LGLGTNLDEGFLVLPLPLLGLRRRRGEVHRRLFEITLRWGARTELLEAELVPAPPKLVLLLVGMLRPLLVVFSVEPETMDLIFLTLVADTDTPEELFFGDTLLLRLAELLLVVDTEERLPDRDATLFVSTPTFVGTGALLTVDPAATGTTTFRDDEESGCGTGFRGTTALLEEPL